MLPICNAGVMVCTFNYFLEKVDNWEKRSSLEVGSDLDNKNKCRDGTILNKEIFYTHENSSCQIGVFIYKSFISFL